MRSRSLALPLILPLLAGACAEPRKQAVSPPAHGFDAAVARSWFDLLYTLVRDQKLSPPVASRTYVYAAVALYEAVVPGMAANRSLGGQLNQLAPLPTLDDRFAYDWPASANAAVARVARRHLAAPASLAAIDALEAEVRAARVGAVPLPVVRRSIERGEEVADAILAWAAEDGFASLHDCPFTPPAGPGLWTPTPPAFAAPLEACWGQMRPFALAQASECDPGPPTPYSELIGSACRAEAQEVADAVNNATAEQKTIALYWADNPGATGTPAGHWVSIVGQLAAERSLTLDVAAEAYARVALAAADGFISCWQSKYVYNLLRPISYIRQVIDPSWLPQFATPPFPEYTSGHSVQSGASAAVLTDLLGVAPFTDTTSVPLGFAPRAFASFEAAADEAALSRLYAGIHFRPACERGIQQGQCVAAKLLARVRFQQ